MNIVKIIVFVIGVSLLTGTVSYAGWFSSKPRPKTEQQLVQENQNNLFTIVPIPQLNTSLERINIKKRLELWNNESKISYIYLIDFGRVVAFHTVKGKITSGNKRLTSNSATVDGDGQEAGIGKNIWNDSGSFTIERPELDGTYGTSGNYIFFWTTDGIYVQWSGNYLLMDEPMKVNIEPALTREIN